MSLALNWHHVVMTQVRRRPDEVRTLLLSAAERLVIRQGTAVSALEIAREAGVHRSVLYRHFSGSEELIQEAALRPFSDFLEMFESLTLEQPDQPQSLWDLLCGFLDRLLTNIALHREFLMAVAMSPDQLGVSSAQLRMQLDSLIERLADINAAQGALRGVDVEPLSNRTRLVLAMIVGLVTYGDWLLPHGPDELSRDALIEQMADLILYGVKKTDPREKARDRRPPR